MYMCVLLTVWGIQYTAALHTRILVSDLEKSIDDLFKYPMVLRGPVSCLDFSSVLTLVTADRMLNSTALLVPAQRGCLDYWP